MNENLLFGLHGSTDWSLPSDWREVSRKFDAALDVIEFCFADFDRMENLKVTDLGDVISAVELVRNTPPQMHTARAKTLATNMRTRDAKSVKYRPRVNALNVMSLVVNPIGTTAGFALGIAGRTVANRVGGHLMIDEAEWLSHALDEVQLSAVDLQLEKIFLQQHDFVKHEEFDQELGRRVYWLGFIYPQNLTNVSSNFMFTTAVANQAISESQNLLNSERRSVNLLMSSPFNPGFMKLDEFEKKLKKGKNVPEMELAWNWKRDLVATRQRHVMPYAQRMGWAKS
jgi:hypothetical protein